jgi:hypothetical protein
MIYDRSAALYKRRLAFARWRAAPPATTNHLGRDNPGRHCRVIFQTQSFKCRKSEPLQNVAVLLRMRLASSNEQALSMAPNWFPLTNVPITQCPIT